MSEPRPFTFMPILSSLEKSEFHAIFGSLISVSEVIPVPIICLTSEMSGVDPLIISLLLLISTTRDRGLLSSGNGSGGSGICGNTPPRSVLAQVPLINSLRVMDLVIILPPQAKVWYAPDYTTRN